MPHYDKVQANGLIEPDSIDVALSPARVSYRPVCRHTAALHGRVLTRTTVVIVVDRGDGDDDDADERPSNGKSALPKTRVGALVVGDDDRYI